MIGEIISIGDELTSGRILNSTSYFAASHLFGAGHEISAMFTIGDEPEMIGSSIKDSIDRADFVVVTGGLGSTSDDLTNEAVAQALDRPTTLYPEIFDKIKRSRRFASMPSLEKLAWLPSGAEILKPEERMAGYLLIYNDKPIFFLPGVPNQMRELMIDRVIPRLATWKGGKTSLVRQKVYKVFGLSEMEINQRLKAIENSHSQVSIGYYPLSTEVHVSLTVRGESHAETERLFQQIEMVIEETMGDSLYGEDNACLEGIVGQILHARKLTIGVAESCSGGLMAHRITTIPGSSNYFLGGVVAYSNDLKERLLSVNRKTLLEYGAVSRQTAREMALGVCVATGSDIGISVTGIAGPTGGTEEKPVGTVCFGLAAGGESFGFLFHFCGKRAMIQTRAAMTGLDLVRRYLLKLELPSD
ncbi:MAG: CinA family nicotinamide mononucleotide deamidase-related protein [Desulfobulbaceae bacterium]|nr:CinA family nicotinamide mononucleotide deamidase-related protein [Desulfobulbaceae bacterium]